MGKFTSTSDPGLPAHRPDVRPASTGWGKGGTQENRGPLREKPGRVGILSAATQGPLLKNKEFELRAERFCRLSHKSPCQALPFAFCRRDGICRIHVSVFLTCPLKFKPFLANCKCLKFTFSTCESLSPHHISQHLYLGVDIKIHI